MSSMCLISWQKQRQFITDALKLCSQEQMEYENVCNKLPSADISGLGNLMPMMQFRLLDVEMGCVKDASLDEVYVALGYVSPAAEDMGSFFRLGKKNIHAAYDKGFIDDIRYELPRTISDAVDFVRALGHKHLWVDALCIVDDDQHEMIRTRRKLWPLADYIRKHPKAFPRQIAEACGGLDASIIELTNEQPERRAGMFGRLPDPLKYLDQDPNLEGGDTATSADWKVAQVQS
ncbi:hypothetical protein PspLS_03932 [Pyricularia sp. CBS 133598]|nr:hypothetical protein PspLS_03932 [Pyricularia sp. CBS 133598]